MLSARTSSWFVCSAYESVPDVHAQCTHHFLTRTLRVYKMNIWKLGKLMGMLNMRIRNWCVCSGCASVPDPYAQRAHKGRRMRVRNSIFLLIFKVPKTSKILKTSIDTNKWSEKLLEKKKFSPKLKKKSSLTLFWLTKVGSDYVWFEAQ